MLYMQHVSNWELNVLSFCACVLSDFIKLGSRICNLKTLSDETDEKT